MESALIVLVSSVVLVVGGRLLMLHDRPSKYEGLLSCALGAGLATSWHTRYPGDFEDLADFLVRRLRHVLSMSQDPIAAAMMALIPASIAFALLIGANYSPHRLPRPIRTIFGPLGRVRRPRVLH